MAGLRVPEPERAPMMRKSNSMLPSSAQKLAFNLGSRDFLERERNRNKALTPLHKKGNHTENQPSKEREIDLMGEEDSMLISNPPQPRRKSSGRREDVPSDPKSYKKGLIKEMIEMERSFTKKYSEHVDSMMKLVRGDISLQKQIESGQYGGNFGAVIRKIRSMVSDKRHSIERLEAQVALFEEKWSDLKEKKRKHVQSSQAHKQPSDGLVSLSPLGGPKPVQKIDNTPKTDGGMRGMKITPRAITPVKPTHELNGGKFMMGGEQLKFRDLRNKNVQSRRKQNRGGLSMGEEQDLNKPGRKLLDYEQFRNMRMGVESGKNKEQAQKLNEFKNKFKRDYNGDMMPKRPRADTNDLMADDDEDLL